MRCMVVAVCIVGMIYHIMLYVFSLEVYTQSYMSALFFCFSFFSFGAGIVVEAPNRFSLSIGRTTNLCFMQYEKQFVPPRAWTNVSICKFGAIQSHKIVISKYQ